MGVQVTAEGAVRAQVITLMGLGSEYENSLSGLLRRQRDLFVNAWYDRIAARYFTEAASFLRPQPDRFENPAAYAFREAIEEIYRALLDDCDVARHPLEYVVKVRAVQETDPSEGVAFVSLIKDIVREKLSPLVSNSELENFDSRVDGITSIAGEMFMANRRKIAELAGLTRISHGLSTAAVDPGMSAALRSVGFLDVPLSTPAESSRRAPCIHARLRRLATKTLEKCGLGGGF